MWNPAVLRRTALARAVGRYRRQSVGPRRPIHYNGVRCTLSQDAVSAGTGARTASPHNGRQKNAFEQRCFSTTSGGSTGKSDKSSNPDESSSPDKSSNPDESSQSESITRNSNASMDVTAPFGLAVDDTVDPAPPFDDDYDVRQGIDDGIDDDDDDDDDAEQQEEERLAIKDELEKRTGRIWSDPWEVSDEDFIKLQDDKYLPDWAPEYVSRIALDRIRVHPGGILTLDDIANLPLPPPVGPLPGKGQTIEYAKYRTRTIINTQIRPKVIELAASRVQRIRKLDNWDDKQDAIDALFETVESELRQSEQILGAHPQFGKWVEQELERYLRSVANQEPSAESINKDSTDTSETIKDAATETNDSEKDAATNDSEKGAATEDSERDAATEDSERDAATEDSKKDAPFITASNDDEALPIFMDCINPDESSKEDPPMVPTIFTPLAPHHENGIGRMVEEWELAAHRSTKRVMLRQCTRTIARSLVENDVSRIYVHGEKGVGKTTTLATIVASARASGYIVLYLPDGDRLRKNGFYIMPNRRKEGMFDLPNLSQEALSHLSAMHSSDMEGMSASHEDMQKHFTDPQLDKIEGYSGSGLSLVELLNHAAQVKANAPMCYSVIVDRLMEQTDKPFLMVFDEFNCYFDRGHYFHMEYDDDVNDPIPYDRITLFEPAINAISVKADETELDEVTRPTKLMKRGGIVVGTTESHAVRRKVTDAMLESADKRTAVGDVPLQVIQVKRYSDLEADHILANFEATGVGKLRLDRGETLLDDNEVAYLKMVSGKVGQELLDASIM